MKNEMTSEIKIDLPPNSRFCVVVHYAEIGLKGSNRGLFENQLRRNIIRALSDTTLGSVERSFGRLLIYFPKSFDWPAISSRLSRVFGIAHFSPAVITDQNIESITGAAVLQMKQGGYKTFRVTTKRSQKEFPMTSPELSALIGASIVKETGTRVDLTNPDRICFIEIFNKNSLIYSEKIAGLGGLPSGVSERAVSLLSSGIDSPVSSWKMIKRGVKLIFVHFHSVPATTQASIENTKQLVKLLTGYQYKSKLYLVPFLAVQQQIMIGSPADYRVLFYRRSMFRMAEMIALRERAAVLVTGENVGQVASQTLSNIRAVNDAIQLPVLRPLAGEDKKEIINLAHQIGTFEISTEPYEDCCSLYVPRHPETKADPKKIEEIDRQLDLSKLHEQALEQAEIIKFRHPEQRPTP